MRFKFVAVVARLLLVPNEKKTPQWQGDHSNKNATRACLTLRNCRTALENLNFTALAAIEHHRDCEEHAGAEQQRTGESIKPWASWQPRGTVVDQPLSQPVVGLSVIMINWTFLSGTQVPGSLDARTSIYVRTWYHTAIFWITFFPASHS